MLRGIFRLRVIPGRIDIGIIANNDRVITGPAFPWAACMGVARLNEFQLHGFCREVVIPLHLDRFIALGDDDIIPQGAYSRSLPG